MIKQPSLLCCNNNGYVYSQKNSDKTDRIQFEDQQTNKSEKMCMRTHRENKVPYSIIWSDVVTVSLVGLAC